MSVPADLPPPPSAPVGPGRADADGLRIGMTDIALLARVRRSAVSNWRSRATGAYPFPPPVGSENDRPLFDAGRVARWLTETGHGNNPSAIEDLAAFATTDALSPREDRAVLNAVTALLCLKAHATNPLADFDDGQLLDLGDELDPDDGELMRELTGVGQRLVPLARYTDLLTDAAFSPAAAFDRLMADRYRSVLADHASTAVHADVLALVARIAVELGERPGVPATYVDTSGSAELLLVVLAEHGDRSPADVLTPDTDDPASRLDRRRLRVHDVYRRGLAVAADGTFAVDRGVTHVALFPSPARPRMTTAEILDAVENIALQMVSGQRGVVLAPASVLTEALAEPALDGQRAAILRAGHVHAVVRLPKGLVPARPRQALALWLLGPADHSTPVADRFLPVADLANHRLDGDVAQGLVTDLAAATGSRTLVHAHAFSYVRFALTRALLTTRGSLAEVGQTATSGRSPAAADLLVEIDRLRAVLDTTDASLVARAAASLDGLHAADLRAAAQGSGSQGARSRGAGSQGARTIGELVGQGRLRVLAGHRIRVADIATGSGVQVIGAAELTGASAVGTRTVDRMRLATYDAVRLTEPGDVVFCTSPRPAAIVDRAGTSVVPFPARVLRIQSSGLDILLPDALAADIAAMPDRAKQWRLWPVRVVPQHQIGMVSTALEALRGVADAAGRRLAAAHALTRLVTDGVASRSLELHPPTSPRKGH